MEEVLVKNLQLKFSELKPLMMKNTEDIINNALLKINNILKHKLNIQIPKEEYENLFPAFWDIKRNSTLADTQENIKYSHNESIDCLILNCLLIINSKTLTMTDKFEKFYDALITLNNCFFHFWSDCLEDLCLKYFSNYDMERIKDIIHNEYIIAVKAIMRNTSTILMPIYDMTNSYFGINETTSIENHKKT